MSGVTWKFYRLASVFFRPYSTDKGTRNIGIDFRPFVFRSCGGSGGESRLIIRSFPFRVVSNIPRVSHAIINFRVLCVIAPYRRRIKEEKANDALDVPRGLAVAIRN